MERVEVLNESDCVANDREPAGRPGGVLRRLTHLSPVQVREEHDHSAQHERDVEHAAAGQEKRRIATSAELGFILLLIPISASGEQHGP